MENNSEPQIKLRKYQNTLVVVGMGVIAFGIWSVIKTVMLTAFNKDEMAELSAQGTAVEVVFWVMLGIMLAIDLWLRLYVGLAAIQEGRGKKRKAYIAWIFLMAFFSALGVLVGLASIGSDEAPATALGTAVVTVIVEATSCVLLVEMARAAVKVKRLSRQLVEQEG